MKKLEMIMKSRQIANVFFESAAFYEKNCLPIIIIISLNFIIFRNIIEVIKPSHFGFGLSFMKILAGQHNLE